MDEIELRKIIREEIRETIREYIRDDARRELREYIRDDTRRELREFIGYEIRDILRERPRGAIISAIFAQEHRSEKLNERLHGEVNRLESNNIRLEHSINSFMNWSKGADAWKPSVCKYDGCKS